VVQLTKLGTQPEYKEIVFVLPNGEKVLAKIRLTTKVVNECDPNGHVVMNDVHEDNVHEKYLDIASNYANYLRLDLKTSVMTNRYSNSLGKSPRGYRCADFYSKINTVDEIITKPFISILTAQYK
jgi:hypothetical protein